MYHPGNGGGTPRGGYGHIAIVVDNIQAACDRFDEYKVPFQKRLTDGKMRHIAFIKDPDGLVFSLCALRDESLNFSKILG